MREDKNKETSKEVGHSAILDGEAVCEGYARAFYMLLDKLDINYRFVSGMVGDILQAWNMVQLDGDWYHVDTTFDDPWDRDVGPFRYRYFLVDDETLRSERSWGGYQDGNGTKYRYYIYEKLGIKADNLSQAKAILNKQYQSTNAGSIKFSLLAHQSIEKWQVTSYIKDLIGDAFITEERHVTNGDYNLYYISTSSKPKLLVEDASFKDVTAKSIGTETTTKLVITLDKEIEGFSEDHIEIQGATKGDLTSIDNGMYELEITDITVGDGNKVTVSLNKRGFNFIPNSQETAVSILKSDTPNAVFTATGEHTGILSNLEVGMRYKVGTSEWNSVTSTKGSNPRGVYTADSTSQVDHDGKLLGVKTYHVRTKPQGTILASEIETFTIGISEVSVPSADTERAPIVEGTEQLPNPDDNG